MPAAKRILELNPDHPAVQALRDAARSKDADDPRVEAYGRLLYDQAVIAEGSKVKDPAGFARRINELIAKAAASDPHTRRNSRIRIEVEQVNHSGEGDASGQNDRPKSPAWRATPPKKYADMWNG